MSVLVKICGITERETISAIRHLRIDYIGFVFAPSRRQVDPLQAAELMQELQSAPHHRRPQVVGVFVDPTMEELQNVMSAAALDVIQLHGGETPEFCQQVRSEWDVKVFKALPVSWQEDADGKLVDGSSEGTYSGSSQPDGKLSDKRLNKPSDTLSVAKQPDGKPGVAESEADPAPRLVMPDEYVGSIDALMLDTYDAKAAGGTGRTFQWAVIPYYLAWAQKAGIPLLVAGGLHAGNVSELIDTYKPHGVDVSSGVETAGVKDIAKITEFVERVKAYGNDIA